MSEDLLQLLVLVCIVLSVLALATEGVGYAVLFLVWAVLFEVMTDG